MGYVIMLQKPRSELTSIMNHYESLKSVTEKMFLLTLNKNFLFVLMFDRIECSSHHGLCVKPLQECVVCFMNITDMSRM
jgi:hypothetical protein